MKTHLREKVIDTRDGDRFRKNASVLVLVIIQKVRQQDRLRRVESVNYLNLRQMLRTE